MNFDRINQMISDRLFDRHPDIFHRESQMQRLVDSVVAPDGTTQVVEAKTRLLKAQMNTQIQSGPVTLSDATTSEDLIADILADEIAAEFRREIEREPQVIYPYKLVDASIVVDPASFTPTVMFKTIYGSLPVIA